MSLLSIFYNTVTNVKGRIKEIFYDTSSKTLSTPNISVEPIDDTTVGELRFKELASNGSSYIGLKAASSLASSSVFELPSSDGNSGQIITTDGNKKLSFSNAFKATTYDFDSTGQTSFVTSETLTNKTLIVMHNGISRRLGSNYDYTVSSATVTFTYTIPNGHWVTIIVLG